MTPTRAARALAFATLFSGVSVACSSGSFSESPGTTGSQGLTSLADACAGQAVCVAGSAAPTTVMLHRDASGAGCVVQGSTLLAGGAVAGNASASWTSDADSVRVCQGASCFTCTSTDASADAGASSGSKPKTKSCHGSTSCPSSPPCAEVRGCNLSIDYHYDGNGHVSGTDYSCEGSPESCESQATSEACERQGCRWE